MPPSAICTAHNALQSHLLLSFIENLCTCFERLTLQVDFNRDIIHRPCSKRMRNIVLASSNPGSCKPVKPPYLAPHANHAMQLVMKPVLTPVRHNVRRRLKSLDSSSGHLHLQIPTCHNASEVDGASIRLQQCVLDGVAALGGVQSKHQQLYRELPCAPAPAPAGPHGWQLLLLLLLLSCSSATSRRSHR